MSRDDARREVRRALGSEHDTTFAERTGLSLKTVSAFLSGRRWPQRPTLTRIEQALGWDVGRITELAEAPDGQDPNRAAAIAQYDVLEAIRRDPRLLPEARAHLENQYQLLLRLQSADSQVVAEQQRRRDAADLEAADRARLDEQGRAALEGETDQSQSAHQPTRFDKKRPRRPLR